MLPRIVFSDVDGTLLSSRLEVLPGTLLAIRSLQRQGIPFVIVSARSPAGIYPIMERNRFTCPLICFSGALILDEKRNRLFMKGMDRDTVREIISFLENGKFACSWNIYTADRWIVRDRSDPRIIREEKIVQANSAEGTADALSQAERVGKILLMCDSDRTLEIEQALKAKYPGLSIARSSDILVEIMAGGVTKSSTVREFCRMSGIDPREAAAFGDHYNDAEMLETVGMPFLMGNAPKELKKIFSQITDTNDEEGIRKGLESLGIIL